SLRVRGLALGDEGQQLVCAVSECRLIPGVNSGDLNIVSQERTVEALSECLVSDMRSLDVHRGKVGEEKLVADARVTRHESCDRLVGIQVGARDRGSADRELEAE